MTIEGTFKVGSAVIEDGLLVVIDKTSARKIRFDNFINATGAQVKIGTTSSTLGKILTDADIDIDNLEQTTYAESVGVSPPNSSTEISTAKSSATSSDDEETSDAVTVNLSEADTSKDGNFVVDGKTVGKLSSTYPEATIFTRNGLTIHLLGELTDATVKQNVANKLNANKPTDSNGNSLITPLTYDELSDNQKTIIAGLFKWWSGDGLTLDEESLGLSFNSASVKDIGLYFYDGQGLNSSFATLWNWTESGGTGITNKLMLSINL